jgi:hypothetical protein
MQIAVCFSDTSSPTHHPDALSQGDARRWPARHGCPEIWAHRSSADVGEDESRFLSRMIDERFATINQRFAAIDRDFTAMDVLLVRLETKTATVAGMDAQLARLETNTATGFRRLRWGLSIVIALVLGLVTKVILDWAVL